MIYFRQGRPSEVWADGGSAFKVSLPKTGQRGVFGKWSVKETGAGGARSQSLAEQNMETGRLPTCLPGDEQRWLPGGHCSG